MKIALMAALCAIVCLGCAPREAAMPQESAPSATPTPALPPAADLQSPGPVSTLAPTDTIDGVAGPDDVLPNLASYQEAKAINDEVIGWITIPNTKIDYPVVRGSDLSYYTTHNVEKEESKYGAIFMDFRNANPAQQRHIIIYGHNMKNGTMFHDLNNYKQRDFFEDNRIITLLWDGVETQWEVYAAYVVKTDEAYYIHTRFGSDQIYVDYMTALLDYAKSSKYSVVDERAAIKATDQVLTLSTCTYEYDSARFAVSARRVL